MKILNKLNNKGFGHIEALFVVLLLVIIGGAYVLVHDSHADSLTPQIVVPLGGDGTPPIYHWTNVGSYATDNPVVNVSACRGTDTANQPMVVGMAVLTKNVTQITPYKSTYFEGKPTSSSYTFREYDTTGATATTGLGNNTSTGTWGLYRKPLSARLSLAFKSTNDTATFAVGLAGQTSVAQKTIAFNKLGKCFQ